VQRDKRAQPVLLYAVIGVGAAAIGALLLAWGLESSGIGSRGEPAASSASVKPPSVEREAVTSSPSADPVVPERAPASVAAPLLPPKPLGPASATAPPAIATPPPSPPPSQTRPLSQTPDRMSPPSFSSKPLPSCEGKFLRLIKKNCLPLRDPGKAHNPTRP
jgi:hypothetical protein